MGMRWCFSSRLLRAKASLHKARASRFKSTKMATVRTEYCKFYNRFGK